MNSINVEYNQKEIIEIILLNILKMLYRRKLIESYEDEFKKLSIENNVNIYKILIKDKIEYEIYFLNAKITTIQHNTPFDDYLSNNIHIHKIIIFKDVSKKVVKQLLTEYKNCEFFFEYEMLEDLPSKDFIPQHELLDINEKNEILNKFKESNLAKILITDIMTRYYNAKIGDIFRIIRPSITAGKNIFYRKVVNGSLDILFI